jgi:hypothetical protein
MRPGQLLEIEPVIEHDDLDPQLPGELDQAEALDLPATGPGIAEQHGVFGRGDVNRSPIVPLVQIAHQRGPAASDHRRGQDGHPGEGDQGALRALRRGETAPRPARRPECAPTMPMARREAAR